MDREMLKVTTSYIEFYEYIVLNNIIMGLQTQKCKILWKLNFQKSALLLLEHYYDMLES